MTLVSLMVFYFLCEIEIGVYKKKGLSLIFYQTYFKPIIQTDINPTREQILFWQKHK